MTKASSPRSSASVGSLKTLVDAALQGDTKWGHVLHYLDAHAVADRKRERVQLPFESPLPACYVASEELALELRQTGVAAFIVALQSAPARIVAALLHLGPQETLVQTVDDKGRGVLHLACKRPWDDDTEQVLEMLITVNPNGLLQRDTSGRTPLHWLLWYHAARCSVKTVALFCKPLPKKLFYTLKQFPDKHYGTIMDGGKINHKKYPLPELPRPSSANKVPHNAAIIPDARFGCLPLHYAVMEGASPEVVQVLLRAYPLAKHAGDRFGRTALHWYLGAEHERHVSGEALNPNAVERWDMRLESQMVQFLLSSRVARTADRLGRYPLHWACVLLAHNYMRSQEHCGECLSLTTIQLLLDHYLTQLTCHDFVNSETPLLLLFSTAETIQEQHQTVATTTPFDPPLELLELLLTLEPTSKHDRPATLEDKDGRLPIHVALSVAASSAVVERFVEAHPLALVHTMEESLQAPLHAALCRPCTAPLQTPEAIDLLLKQYVASKHGTVVDGRLALKMEDAVGSYPIHYACQNKASVAVIKLLVERYPRTALLQNADGDLPVHCLLDDDLLTAMSVVSSGNPLSEAQLEQVSVIRQKLEILIPPLLSDASKLEVVGSQHGMLPLHLAVLFQAASYPALFRMLQLFPDGASQFTQHQYLSYSALDLHEMIKTNWLGEMEQWQHVRELLFCFSPTLESHRHREELLDRCVRIVVDEVNGVGSYHSKALESMDSHCASTLQLPNSLSSMEPSPNASAVVVSSDAIHLPSPRKQMSRKPPTPSRKALARRLHRKNMAAGGVASIYDDNNLGMNDYTASVGGSSEDNEDASDNDSYFEKISQEEEVSGEEESEVSGPTLTDLQEEEYDVFDSFTAMSYDTYVARQIDEASTMDFLFSAFAGAPSTSTTSEGTFQEDPTFSSRESIDTEDRFDAAKKRMEEEMEEEEKKEEEESHADVKVSKIAPTPKVTDNKVDGAPKMQRVGFLGEVALRLWTFFALYSDRNNPNDNYVHQMAHVFEEISFSDVGRLVSVPLPSIAAKYLPNVSGLDGLTFRDIASPKCRELIHKTCYFVGKYDFDVEGADSLIHRSSSGNTVVLRAYEWLFTTEETTDAINPGMSEAEIWATGERPSEMGLTFKARKRPVWMKFTKDASVYENEIACRYGLGVPVDDDHVNQGTLDSVVPLLGHYNSLGTERTVDRSFNVDLNDERFKELRLFADSDDPALAHSIVLKEYPYALVYPAATHGTLADYYRKHGIDSTLQVKEVCSHVGRALQVMHSKGYVHRGVSMERIVLHPVKEKKGRSQHRWLLSDLVLSTFCPGQSRYLGKINSQGVPEYWTQTLPPEAFVQLSPEALKVYNRYWRKVETKYGVKVAKSVIQPIADVNTGELYVVRCHFEPKEAKDAEKLPPLPYELVPVEENSDIWAFGKLLFTLSSGRSLFPSSIRTGDLLGYEAICNWNKEEAQCMIFEHVPEPLAQDLLLQLLSPLEERKQLSMDVVLRHPFLASKHASAAVVKQIIDKRKQETAAQARRLMGKVCEASDKGWLEKRSIQIACWDYDLLERVHLSSTQVIQGMMDQKVEIPMPCSFVLLPYKLHRNKQGLCTPTSKSDVEKAERMGTELLGLSKACYFASVMKQGVSTSKASSPGKWSSTEILRVLDLSSADFGDVQSEMSGLAAMHVEKFRDDPMSIAVMMVQQRVWRVLACFDDTDTFLYLVDELNGVPVDDGSEEARFPVLVSKDRQEEVVQRGLLFMHLSCLYARGVAKSVSGLVKLIFEAAHPHIPPSWAEAAKGLNHQLDEAAFANELMMLQDALTDMFSSKHRIAEDDRFTIREYFADVDPKRTYAGLRRIVTGGACLWTTEVGAQTMAQSAKSLPFQEALRQKRAIDAKLKKQERPKKGTKQQLESNKDGSV